MNIEEYISSGAIEAYVLGMVTEAEQQELFQMAAEHEAVRKALAEAEESLQGLAYATAEVPPPVVKEKLWAELGFKKEDEEKMVPPVYTTEKIEKVAGPKTVSLWPKLAVAASIALLAGLLLLFTKYNSLTSRTQELETELAASKKVLDSFALVGHVKTDASYDKVALAGTENHPGAFSAVYWNKQTQTVYIDHQNMPKAAAGKQYQLWAIVGGKPVDLGVLSLDDKNTWQKMKNISGAEMFAITLEDEGGKPVPTLDQMYVAGKTS